MSENGANRSKETKPKAPREFEKIGPTAGKLLGKLKERTK